MSDIVHIHGKQFREIISYAALIKRVEEIATSIQLDYDGMHPVFLPVLNGSFMFTADLMRHIKAPCEIEFVNAKSYQGTQSTGKVEIETFFKRPKADRHVIILEDIVKH